MSWPTTNDYFEAVQNLRSSVRDEELRHGEPALNPLGLPVLWSGNFAQVFKVHCPSTGNTWALKCFTRESPGLCQRYRHIAAYLEEARLPFTVDFQWLEEGIRAGGASYPVLKMRWVEGLTLNQFVQRSLSRPERLRKLLDVWRNLAAGLRQSSIAHGDLQHGNVLLVPVPGRSPDLKLVDYDGMHVPRLAGTRSGELGHPAYQHPQRLRDGTYNLEVDRFSHLAIYTAVRCLIAQGRSLWKQFNNDDNLLFREQDFQDPGASEAFAALWRLEDAECRALAGRLSLACIAPLDEVPLLDEVLVDGTVRPLAPDEEKAVAVLLGERKRPAASVRAEQGAPVSTAGQAWWTSAPAPADLMPPRTVATPAAKVGTTASKSRRAGDHFLPRLAFVGLVLLVCGALAAVVLHDVSDRPSREMAESRDEPARRSTRPHVDPEVPRLPARNEGAQPAHQPAVPEPLASHSPVTPPPPAPPPSTPSRATFDQDGRARSTIGHVGPSIFDNPFTAPPNVMTKGATGRGIRAVHSNDVDGAIAEFNSAIAINSRDQRAFFNRGVARLLKGQTNSAIADFSEAIRIEPRYAYAYAHRALAWERKGEAAKAQHDYEMARRLGMNIPNRPKTHTSFRSAYDSSPLESAMEYYRKREAAKRAEGVR